MSEPKDFRFGCEFYTSVALKAAEELRRALAMDEQSFRRTAPALWKDPRPAFLYSVLDEVQKAGVSIKDWSEKLGESESRPEHTDHLIRMVTQWQQDEQSFRARKLLEILVDLICFSETNEPGYYRDYLRLKELDSTVRSLNDQQEFFGFRRKNTEYGLDWSVKDIQSAENSEIDVSKRWYLRKPGPLQEEWKTRGVPFSSFRDRYKRILGIALPNELGVIGKSYVHAYGMSADIHFSPYDTSSSFDEDDIYIGVDRVGLLCYAIIIRCQRLLGVVPEGMNTKLRELHDENGEPARLVAALKKQVADVGDFVWAEGFICRVTAVRKSKYGYTNYRLRYVEKPPIPEVQDDYYAGGEIRLVAKKSYGEEALLQLQQDPTLDEETRKHFSDITKEKRDEIVGQAVVKLFRLQQRLVAQRKREGPQNSEKRQAGSHLNI